MTSLDRLRRIAEDIRALPQVYPDTIDDVKTGIVSVDEALIRQKREDTFNLMEDGGALVGEAVQYAEFNGHAAFRRNVKNSLTDSERFVFAATEFASLEIAQSNVRLVCERIASAIDEEIRRMEEAERTEPKVVENQKRKTRGIKGKNTRKIDVATTIVVRHPELKDAKIAEQAGCHRSLLTKNKDYQKNADMARRAMARQQRHAGFDARTREAFAFDDDPDLDC